MSISVDKVTYAAGNTVIVNGISISVEKGKVLGLLGPNGSGKSSLLRLICRLRQVKSGIIRLGDDDVSGLSRAALARRIAFVEQQSTTDTQLTVRDIVRLGRTPHRGLISSWGPDDDAAVAEALARVDMTARSGQLWQTLSGGERQRVHIA
ncbi:MAG: ABC transporter ATP-binding protein, partial [Rhizobium sp.]